MANLLTENEQKTHIYKYCTAHSQPDMIDIRACQQHTALLVAQQLPAQFRQFSGRHFSTTAADEVRGKCVRGMPAVAADV